MGIYEKDKAEKVMDLNRDHLSGMLPDNQISRIKEEIERLAEDHLKAGDAASALSHYSENVTAVSNQKIYSSFEALAVDIKSYYSILKKVDLAVWDKIFIDVINVDTVLFTAQFRYSFTDNNNKKTNLKGIWTALFIRHKSCWKIRMRHESFDTVFVENDDW